MGYCIYQIHNFLQSMKPKIIIASATLLTLSCIYLVRLNDKADDFAADRINAQINSTDEEQMSNESLPMLNENDLRKPLKRKKTDLSTIYIDPNQDNLVYGNQGTGLFFPANCFMNEDGKSITGKVKIQLNECYTIPEMIEANLSTTSDGRLLETAGMVDIHAFSSGKAIVLKSDASYEIYFPKNENDKVDFKLFYGEWQEDGMINWNLAGSDEAVQSVAEDNPEYSDSEPQEFYSEPENIDTDLGDVKPYKSILGDDEYCFLQISESNLRRGTRISEMDYFNWRLADGQTLNQWFVANFNPDLEMLDKFCVMGLRSEITFKVDRNGAFQSYYISKSSIPEYDRAIVDFLQTMPPLDLDQLMPTYLDDHACILTFGSRQGKDQQAFADVIRKKFASTPDAKISGIDASTLDYFVFTSSELGWINCDRFMDNESPLVNYSVKNQASDNGTISLVFDDMNSVLKGVKEGGFVTFNNVPANKKVRLIGLDNYNKEPLMCLADGNTNDNKTELNAYKPFSLNELENQFAKRKN